MRALAHGGGGSWLRAVAAFVRVTKTVAQGQARRPHAVRIAKATAHAGGVCTAVVRAALSPALSRPEHPHFSMGPTPRHTGASEWGTCQSPAPSDETQTPKEGGLNRRAHLRIRLPIGT